MSKEMSKGNVKGMSKGMSKECQRDGVADNFERIRAGIMHCYVLSTPITGWTNQENRPHGSI